MAFRRSHRTSAHADLPAPDQTLRDLVNGLRDLTERVSTMERQFDVLGNLAAGTTGHDDDGVMDLRLQVARLSAELSRVAVEINARIADVAGAAGGALSDDSVVPVPTPELEADESPILDTVNCVLCREMKPSLKCIAGKWINDKNCDA